MKKIICIISSKIFLFCSLIIFVLLTKYYFIKIKEIFVVAAICLFFIIIFCIISKKYELVISFKIFLIVFTLLFIRVIKIKSNYEKIIDNFSNIEEVIGYINSFPIKEDDFFKTTIKIIGIRNKQQTDFLKISPFLARLKIKKTDSFELTQGSLIRVKSKIKMPREKIFSFEYRDYLFNKKIFGVIDAKKNSIKKINNKKNIFAIKILQKTIWNLRNEVVLRIKKEFSNRTSSFLLSIFLGLRSEIDEETSEHFSNTGMTHLLAISGLHIGFVGFLFFKLFKIFLSKSKSLVISIFFLMMYIFMITPSASSMRAFIMYVLFVFYFITGMKTSGITILSISGIILIFINPYVIFDLGFQFSFMATAGIILLSGHIGEKLPYFIHNKFKSGISATLSAFSSVAGLQWAVFDKIPFFSLISSILIVPFFGFYFALTFILLILFFLSGFNFLSFMIEIFSIFFLKTIDIFNFIPALKLPQIPRFIAYIFLPAFILYFYAIDKKIVELIKKIKLNKLEKILRIKTRSLNMQ